MLNYFGGPYRFRTWLRGHSPWALINLGVFGKGADCEAAGGDHEWYKKDDKHSACYHCKVMRAGRLWRDPT